MDKVKGFMDWWGDYTGLETKVYNMWILGPTPVSWVPVSLGLTFIFIMVFFFKGGLLDYWGILW
jgi:hypothetical protein